MVLSAVAAMTLGVFSASATAPSEDSGAISVAVAGVNDLIASTTGLMPGDGKEAGADKVIATGTIDNNSLNGWKLTVESANLGMLKNASTTNSINYNSIVWVKGADGILGAGLTDPASDKQVTAAPAVFSAGTAATTATEAYAFILQINWAADSTQPAGTYDDTITMTLSDAGI